MNSPAGPGRGDARRWKSLFHPLETVLLATLVALGLALWLYRSYGVPDRGLVDASAGDVSPTSVAVLPFEDVADEPGQEYFSQGVSDEIRAALARVPGLEVASRTSSYARARDGRGVAEIAAELKVASILEGTVQRVDGRMRVTVSLVDARTDRQLWIETFDRELDIESLFEVEEEIARSVAEALQGELQVAGSALTGPVPASLEAHDLYLLGLYHWNRRTGEELLRAGELFGRSAALDPGYALARAGLASTYVLLPLYGGVPAHEAMPEAKEAARSALALDSTLAEAHAALGLVQTAYDFDWEGAEGSFRRAIELNARYATAHQWYGLLLDVTGRFEEARARHERALELDPLSGIINETMGNHLIFTGRHDAAIEQLRHTLELLPDLPLALQFLGEAYLLTGRFDDAERTLRRWARLMGTREEPWSRVVDGARSPEGREDAVQAVRGMAAAGTISPYWQAQYYALVGAEGESLAALRTGMETRDFLMFFVGADPAFDALRSDAAFREAVAEMPLPATGEGG